jgi:molybdopterin converting factor small subunit
MRSNVFFFGATAEITGQRQMVIEVPEDSPARFAFDQVLAAYPQLASHRLLFSLNHQYATGDEVVQDGDELAIFTAVSGG